MSSSSFVKLCTAALAGSILGIAYERMPPASQWPDLFQTVSAASSLVPTNNNRIGKQFDFGANEGKLIPIDPVVSGENFKHSAKFGLPSQDNLRLFDDFVLSYDRRLRAPNWVIEHLTPEKLKKQSSANRDSSKFVEDLALHEYFRAKNSDFSQSGYDRGHMAAAGNHKINQAILDQTFTLSNVMPQKPELNRGLWERLESYVRWRANKSKNLYVVSGPLYLPMKARDGNLYVTYKVLGNNHVSVPTHFFKVFLVETQDSNLILEAFLMPNDEKELKDRKIDDFRIPIERLDIIERSSGVILFDKIPRDKIQAPRALAEGFKDVPYNERKKLQISS